MIPARVPLSVLHLYQYLFWIFWFHQGTDYLWAHLSAIMKPGKVTFVCMT